jgi:hypothetical protein
MKKCDLCGKKMKEAYRVALYSLCGEILFLICHDCMVDLEDWLENRKSHG